MITPPSTLTPRQARFVENWSSGKYGTQAEAAIAAEFAASRARITASQILARDDAKAYLAALQKPRTMETQELVDKLSAFYLSIVDAAPSAANESSPISIPVFTKEGVEYQLPDKLAAANALTRLHGLDKKEENPLGKLGNVLEAILEKRDI